MTIGVDDVVGADHDCLLPTKGWADRNAVRFCPLLLRQKASALNRGECVLRSGGRTPGGFRNAQDARDRIADGLDRH